MARMSFGIALALFVAAMADCRHSAGPARHESRFPSGKVSRTWHVDENGRLHGEEVRYREDGTIEKKSEYDHGSWFHAVTFWENGQPMEEAWGGILSTERRYWDEDGNELFEKNGAVTFPR